MSVRREMMGSRRGSVVELDAHGSPDLKVARLSNDIVSLL